MQDAEGLFQCYGNPKSAKYFNGDCCGDDFYYTDFGRFVKCMEFWESRYQEKDFVRFTIMDIKLEKVIGMAAVLLINIQLTDIVWESCVWISCRNMKPGKIYRNCWK